MLAIDIAATFLYTQVTKLVFEVGEKDFTSNISNCCYASIKDVCDEGFDFNAICKIERNKNGDISFISTDTLLANYLSQKISLKCYNYLSDYIECGVYVPQGAFTGIRMLSGLGKQINVKLISKASIQCEFKRTFASVGINQTRQTLSAIIHTEIYVINSFCTKNVQDDIEVTIFDNLIIGKVPEVYLTTETI